MLFFAIAVPLFAVLQMYPKFEEKFLRDREQMVRIAIRNTVISVALVGVYFLVISTYASILTGSSVFLRRILAIALAFTSVRAIPFVYGIYIRNIPSMEGYIKRKNCWFWVNLLDLFVMLLIASSMFNYSFLMLVTDWFNCQFDLLKNCYFTGFECIYYTFTLITTSGDSSIIAIHPLARVIEMVETLVFYVVYGCWLTNLMSNDES